MKLNETISSHCENSVQTASQNTGAEIQKHTSLTQVVDEDKRILVQIDLKQLSSETLRDIIKKSKPETRDLIGSPESHTMYSAAHSSVQRDSCVQNSVTSSEFNVAQSNANTKGELNKNMPEIEESIEGNGSTTSQSESDRSSEPLYLSDQIQDLLGDSELSDATIADEGIVATFSFEENNAVMNDAHVLKSIENGPEQGCKIVCLPFYYNKTSKRNNLNLRWTTPSLLCNITDMVEPEVLQGIVDRDNKSIVISIVPSRNMNKPRRNRLTYKVQYRMSLKSKTYAEKFAEANEVVRELKRRSALSITPDPDDYDSRHLSYNDIMCKRIKLSLLTRPFNFLIPMTATGGNGEYTEECVAERISFEELSKHPHESWCNVHDKNLCCKVGMNSDVYAGKELDIAKQKHLKRYSNEDISYENKRKCIPEIEYHDTINKNEEFIHSMRTDEKGILKRNDDDKIIMSRNKTIGTIQKNQKDVSLSKIVNSTMTQNEKFSKKIVIRKNMPWDFALRTSQYDMPVIDDVDKPSTSKSYTHFTNNEIAIPEVVDDEEDDALETRNAFETSVSDRSGCSMKTVSVKKEVQNDVGDIVKRERNRMFNENYFCMPDIKEDTEEIVVVESFFENNVPYPFPNDGSVWEITVVDSGLLIYDNVKPTEEDDDEFIYEENEEPIIKVENQLMHEESQDNEFPLLDNIKSSDSDAEIDQHEEEEIAESDVLNLIDEEKITISEVKIELCDEENSQAIDLSNTEKKPICEISSYEEDNTIALYLDIGSLNTEKPGKLDSGTQVVGKEQTVDTDVQSNPSREEISMEQLAEDQTIKSDSKINNNNKIHDKPLEGTKSSDNPEHDKLVNNSPIIKQNELNFHTCVENQNPIKSMCTMPEIRRTSATTFEIRFNDFQQNTPSNPQPEVEANSVIKETNIINDVASQAQKKEGKIIILEDKIVKLNESGAPVGKQSNFDYQGISMIPQNTNEQTESQSVTINDHQPVSTVPQHQVTRETQQPVIKQFQQSDTGELPQFGTTQFRQRVIEEPRQPLLTQESVTTEPQLPVIIAKSGILQPVNNQNTSMYPVPMNTTSVIIQKATDNQMPRVPLQITGMPMPKSYMSGYAQNYNDMHQMKNSQISSTSNLQDTQRNETGELRRFLFTGNNHGIGQLNNEEARLKTPVQNHNLPIPYSAQNVQHQQKGPIAGGNQGETMQIISLNDKDIRVRQYNEIQVPRIPAQENNMLTQKLYQNPVAQHNQMSMLSNSYSKPIESARSVASVNQYTGNTVAQMPYQGQSMISQYSNQHYRNPQNHQMPNNQTVQSGQHQRREHATYNENNIPSMDLPRTSMYAQQNNQTQIVTKHQPIPEPTRNGLIQSTQSNPMLPMLNNGAKIGANGINMMQNPSIEPINNPYAVVPYRNVNNITPRNAPLQHNGAAINNNNIHSYQPSVPNQPTCLPPPPPYPGHMQHNIQTLQKNNMEHGAPSLQTIHQNCVNSNIMCHRIMIDQQNQMQVMNMKIVELKEALHKQTTTAPRRGRKKSDNNNEAIPPVAQNCLQQRLPENTGQQVMPIARDPFEHHDLTDRNRLSRNNLQPAGPVPNVSSEAERVAYQNYLTRNNLQPVGPGPYVPSEDPRSAYLNHPTQNNPQPVGPRSYVPSEDQRSAYRNHPAQNNPQPVGPGSYVLSEAERVAYQNYLARNNLQPVGPGPYVPSQDQRSAYRNHPAQNNPQPMGPGPYVPSEDQRSAYRNHPAQNNPQPMGPGPFVPSEDQRSAYRNHPAQNNPQPVGSGPYVPSQENYLKYLNRPPGMDSQQAFPVPRVPPVPPEEHNLKYQNRSLRKDSRQVNSTPLVSIEEGPLKYSYPPPGIDSQQVRSVPRTHLEEQYWKYISRPPGMDSQQAGPGPVPNFVEQRLKYNTLPPIQQNTQERYQPTPGQQAGPAQNVIPVSLMNAHYPKSVALGSQNVSVVQPSVPLGTPAQSTSHYQPQGSHVVNIYNRPVRNEGARQLQNVYADKMHEQVQSNTPVDQLSNENGPINLSIHDQKERNKPQQGNNMSNEATPGATCRKGNKQAGNDLETPRKQIQKKQNTAPRNESRDSGYFGSPRKAPCYGKKILPKPN